MVESLTARARGSAGRHPTGHGECRSDGGPRHRSRPRQLRLRRRRAAWPSARGHRRRRHRHRRRAGPPERRLATLHARLGDLLDEHEPDAVALEALYFGQNVRTAFAVGQARGVVLLAAGQRGDRLRRLHPAAGQGRGLRHRPRRQGPGRAHGPDAAVAARAAAARPRRRRARRRHLPRQPRAARRGGRRWPGDRARRRRGGGPPPRPRRGRDRGRGRLPPGRLGRDAAPGPRRGPRRCRCTPTWSCATTRWPSTASPPRRSATSSWPLIGVQSVGPKVALAVLSGGTPRELVAALVAGDVARLQAVPGHRQAHGRADRRRAAREGRRAERPRRRRSPSRAATIRATSPATACSSSASSPPRRRRCSRRAEGETAEELLASALRGARG